MATLHGSGSSGPVPVRLEKKLPAPPVYAALGMAAAYYGYPFFGTVFTGLLCLLFIAVAVICFLRVRRDAPGANRAALYRAGLVVTAAAVGFSLGVAARRTVTRVELGLAPERITAVSGILTEDPRTLRSGSGLGILDLRQCAAGGGLRASAAGSVTVFFPDESIPRLREFGRGAEIYADGNFIERDDAAGGGRALLFRASSVHVVRPASALEQFRTDLRVKALGKFQNRRGGEPVVWGGLASALLLGIRDDLETDLSDGFRDCGCSHILALSGMHLAILSGVLAFLLKRPLGLRVSSLAGAVFIILYVFVAGSQPSLVRAAIMYLLGTVALWGFLKQDALSLLGMAFIIQLIFQSGTGLSYSFILSYLALAGILTLGDALHGLFRGRLPEIFARVLSASLGAFIVTSPVIALFFDSLKPIGIIAGLVLAPFTSLFMVISLAALAASFLPFPLFGFFDFVLSQFYRFLKFLVSSAARVPGISVSGPGLVLVFALLFCLCVFVIQKRDTLHRESVAPLD